MKKVFIFLSLQTICFIAFCQNPRWAEFGTRIPAVTNLDVRWNTPTAPGIGSNVPTNAWHPTLGIYQLRGQSFSPQIISNLMAIGSFTDKDKVEQTADEMAFRKAGRTLTFTFSTGSVDYETPEKHYSPTNLALAVPSPEDIPGLVTNFLPTVGISPAELLTDTNGAPAFNLSAPYTWFYVGDQTVTNVPFRSVVLTRGIEGGQVIGGAGHCRIEYGEHGQIIQIQMSWPSLERLNSVPTLGPTAIVQAFRQGKAIQGFLPTGFADIDWFKVKSVTVNQAWPCYFAGGTRRLYPFLALWANVVTDHGSATIELDCPAVDERKL
jgi:hypothetical protein